MIGIFCKIIFYQAVSLIKISIALFIRRLASGVSSSWRWFCDIFLITVGAYMLLALFWLVFTCSPVQAQWSLYARGVSEPLPRCLDTILQGRILSGIHVAQGMILLSAPIVILWAIRMNRAKKFRLFLIWIVGGVTVLGGLLRQVRPLVHRDMTWDYVEVLAWTCLDLALGIVTASLPVLDGMLSNVWDRAMASIGISSHGQRAPTWSLTNKVQVQRRRVVCYLKDMDPQSRKKRSSIKWMKQSWVLSEPERSMCSCRVGQVSMDSISTCM